MLGQRSFDDLGVPLAEATFCVLDLETTGGDRNNDMITEIGAVKVRGGECLATFQTLVNPGRAIPPRISVLTGLTDALVCPAPRIGAVLGSLVDFIGDAVFVGHNVGFDLGVPAGRARTRRPHRRSPRPWSTRRRSPAGSCATRFPIAASERSPAGSGSTTARPIGRSTTRSPRPTSSTCCSSGPPASACSGSTISWRSPSWPGTRSRAKLKLTAQPARARPACTCSAVTATRCSTSARRPTSASAFGATSAATIAARSVRCCARPRRSGISTLPDPLSAAVVESRLIASTLPRYNRAGTRADKYCYVRLDTDSAWPRLAVVREPARTGVHLGPLPSRTMAFLVVEAILSALPLRRCSTRLGRLHVPSADAAPCVAAQLGVAQCPCAGFADQASYDGAVRAAVRALTRRSVRGRRGAR